MSSRANITPPEKIPFTKMHGAGNDFVVLDLRNMPPPTPAMCAAMSDRHRGIGCDLILGIESPITAGAVASFRIWTADGQNPMQCGNGLRCIAAWARKTGLATSQEFYIDSPSGPIPIKFCGPDMYSAELAVPDFAPGAIPLTGLGDAADSYTLTLPTGEDICFGAVSMGNPHAVVEVSDVAQAQVDRIGPLMQVAPELPPSVNVGFVEVCTRDHVRLRVFEFGAGETLACGSGACAAAAHLMRHGRIARDVNVSLPGGTVRITWPDTQSPILMTGPAAFVFEGEFEYATV